MKREIVQCDGSVMYVRWDGDQKVGYTEPQPCKSPAAYEIEDGRHLCSVHARGLFTDYALSTGYAKRMFGDPKNNHGPLYVFDTPNSAICVKTDSKELN